MQSLIKSTTISRSAIPHGGVSEIARAAGVTPGTARKVLIGKSKNRRVLRALASYLEELEQDRDMLKRIAPENIN